jgi:hemerythrin HHE cation binding domain-containing protein
VSALDPFLRHHARGREQARCLRWAARGDAERRRWAGVEFLAYFREQVLAHIRAEETLLFPLVAQEECAAQLLIEHERLLVFARRLEAALEAGGPEPGLLTQIAALLRAHIRREEHELYPLVARLLADGSPPALALAAALA